MPRKLFVYEIGETFGDMKIVDRFYDYVEAFSKGKFYQLECHLCGRLKKTREGNITRGGGTLQHKTCGYGLKSEYPHLYQCWANSIQRITNPNNPDYPDYGGRGLTHDFPLFVDFFDHVIDRYREQVGDYGEFNTTIERINVDKGYVYNNIDFVTWDEQAGNKRRTVYFRHTSPDGKIGVARNYSDFARLVGLHPGNIQYCLDNGSVHKSGWSFERITKKQHDFEQLVCNNLAGIPIERLEQMASTKSIPVPPNLPISELISRIARWATDERMPCGA